MDLNIGRFIFRCINRGLVLRYIDNKNVCASSAVDDFRIRVKDNAFTLGDLSDRKKYIHRCESRKFKNLTARFINYYVDQTDCPEKTNIEAARQAFYMIKKDPKAWKELGHKILNADSYDAEPYGIFFDKKTLKPEKYKTLYKNNVINRIIQQNIFKELYETKVQDIKINPPPIWLEVFYSEVHRIAHNLSLLNPLNFFFKKTQEIQQNPPKDHNLTILGDIHDKNYCVDELTKHIQSLVDNPEMNDKKIIIAYERNILSRINNRRNAIFILYDKIDEFNKIRKKKNLPLIELKEIDREYADIASKNPEIKPEDIDIGLALLDKYKDKLEMSEDAKKSLDDLKEKVEFEKTNLLDQGHYNSSDTQTPIMYKILLSNWDKINNNDDKKIIYEKIDPLLSTKLSKRLEMHYGTQLEKIKITFEKGDTEKAQQQFNELMEDPKIKDAMHFTYDYDDKIIIGILLDPENSLKDKIDAMSKYITNTMLTSYLRSGCMLGETREWRSNAEKEMKKHPIDSEEYKEAKEMADAHIVMFMGYAHLIDLKPQVDGAKIINGLHAICDDIPYVRKRKKRLVG